MSKFNKVQKFIMLVIFSLCMVSIAKDGFSLNNPAICNNKDPAISKPQPATITDLEVCTQALNGSVQIPIANFNVTPLTPLQPFRVTQEYNNERGHNGLDLGGECTGGFVGKEEIHAALPGVVIISSRDDDANGWGNAVLIATRANDYSDEIITNSYHHLDKRFLGKCTQVNIGDWVGMEGATGHTDHQAHLHFTVRRWKNLAELAASVNLGVANTFGGPGYGAHNGPHLIGHLDPEGLLLDTFKDYQLDSQGNPPSYNWSQQYVFDMRHRGIEFGLFTGKYGAGEDVKRREAARWLKIAARRNDLMPSTATFADVPKTDSDYPYVEALLKYPSSEPVLNKDASVSNNKRYFHPDSTINRAEALKMVILAFYSSEFWQVYNDFIWTAQEAAATQLLGQFQDVSPSDWFAPYVYFGAQKSLVTHQANFNPANTIKREEMAKWVSVGAAKIQAEMTGPCSSTLCPTNYYCDPTSDECKSVPTCVPSETQPCEAGGGYTENGGSGGTSSGNTSSTTGAGGSSSSSSTGTGMGGTGSSSSSSTGSGSPCDNSPQCIAGQTQSQSCNGSGTQTMTCDMNCQWGSWSACSINPVCITNQTMACGNCGLQFCDGAGQWSSCQNQGSCSAGQSQSQSCNASGTQNRTCQNDCNWSSWSPCSVNPVCSPGQNQQQSCTTNGGQLGSQTRTCDATSQWGSWSSCAAQCQDTYLASSSPACYSTPNGPTLCLYVQQISGANWKAQVCKQGGTFVNNYTSVLKDDNNLVQLGSISGNPGDTCTPWQNFSVSYLSGYGTANGAGVRAIVSSPASCSQSSCQYFTGTITVYKQCQ